MKVGFLKISKKFPRINFSKRVQTCISIQFTLPIIDNNFVIAGQKTVEVATSNVALRNKSSLPDEKGFNYSP